MLQIRTTANSRSACLHLLCANSSVYSSTRLPCTPFSLQNSRSFALERRSRNQDRERRTITSIIIIIDEFMYIQSMYTRCASMQKLKARAAGIHAIGTKSPATIRSRAPELAPSWPRAGPPYRSRLLVSSPDRRSTAV